MLFDFALIFWLVQDIANFHFQARYNVDSDQNISQK